MPKRRINPDTVAIDDPNYICPAHRNFILNNQYKLHRREIARRLKMGVSKIDKVIDDETLNKPDIYQLFLCGNLMYEFVNRTKLPVNDVKQMIKEKFARSLVLNRWHLIRIVKPKS